MKVATDSALEVAQPQDFSLRGANLCLSVYPESLSAVLQRQGRLPEKCGSTSRVRRELDLARHMSTRRAIYRLKCYMPSPR